jgi:hypothetical protein
MLFKKISWTNQVLSDGSMAVKIEESMNLRITLCQEHIMTIGFPNYKCILMHTKETHFYLMTY